MDYIKKLGYKKTLTYNEQFFIASFSRCMRNPVYTDRENDIAFNILGHMEWKRILK